MADEAKSETIEQLLDAANASAAAARSAWLTFIGILAYLLVTITSTTHADLLVNNPVTLPVLQVKVPLLDFFIFAPVLLLLLHLGLLVQHAVTAKKLHALNTALEGLDDAKRGLVRERLNHYSFSQYLSGKYSETAINQASKPEVYAGHRWMIWLMQVVSLVILPGIVFLYFQIGFLPYHSTASFSGNFPLPPPTFDKNRAQVFA